VFDFLLRLRSNELGQIALEINGDLHYSSFVLCCNNSDSSSPTITLNKSTGPLSPPTPLQTSGNPLVNSLNLSYISLLDMFKVIVTCLKQERSWPVLQLVLSGLRNLLTNKPIVLVSEGNDIVKDLSLIFSSMVKETTKKYPETLLDVPPKFTKSDFQAQIFPLLETLVVYGRSLDSQKQVRYKLLA